MEQGDAEAEAMESEGDDDDEDEKDDDLDEEDAADGEEEGAENEEGKDGRCLTFGMPEGLKGQARRMWLSNVILGKLVVSNVLNRVSLALILKKSNKMKAQLIGKDRDEGVKEAQKHTDRQDVCKLARDLISWGKLIKETLAAFAPARF